MSESEKKKLNLSREGINTVKVPSTPEEAALFMAQYNQTMMDAQLNNMALLNDIAESLRVIAVDIADALEYFKIVSLKQNLLTEEDIENQEAEEGDIEE